MKALAFGCVAIITFGASASCGSPSQPTGPSGVPGAPPPAAPPSYQFGAKFEPPVGRVVHGMGQWVEYNPKYTAVLPAALQPASQLVFLSIGDTTRPWNPAQIAQTISAIGAAGRIPAIDIGLRGNQPSKAQYDTLGDKLFAIDDEVANGSQWDGRLGDLVQLLRAYGRPVLARVGGEFNGWWNGYHPYEFPKAFRKIVGMFRSAGAGNVAFVWCYEPAAPEDFDAGSGSGWKWYPGPDVVDWFSVDLFAKDDLAGPVTSHGSLTHYGRVLKFLDMAVAAGKPVVIAESSPQAYDLSVGTTAQAAWGEWFSPYFALIASRPEIKWFHYIDYDWTKSSYYAAAGWKNNDLSVAAAIVPLYVAELGKSRYLHAGELGLLKDYSAFP